MVEWKSLGDICEIKGRIGFRGYTRDDQVDKGEGAISLSPGNINDGVVNYDSCTYITWNKYEESPEIMVSEGDIILCKTASVGKVARIHSLPEKATINPQLVLIKNFKTDPQFLFYVLSDSPFQSRIKGLAGVGSVPNVSQAKLASIHIPIPSLSEQQRIVGILDTFTSSIENLKEQIAQRRKQYEYYRDQLLDLEGKPGVEMKTLGEVCEISGDYGLSAPSKPYDGVRYLRITDITDSGGLNNEYVSADLKEDAGKEPLVDGDILFARTGATVGKTLVYRSNFGKCLFAGYLIRYRARKQVVFPQYLFHFTHSTKYYNWVSASLAVGAQPNISAQRYNQLQFPLPSLSEQQRIVSILDTFEASIRNLEQQLAQREKQYEYYRNKLLTFEE